MTETRTGTCLCGAAQFEADLHGAHYHACHCAKCRKWDGGPAFACPASAVRVTEGSPVTAFSSSAHGERVFCTTCGTHLFWQMKEGGMYAVWVGALDESDDLKFESQIFIDRKPSHYAFANETTDMTGDQVMAAFAGGQS